MSTEETKKPAPAPAPAPAPKPKAAAPLYALHTINGGDDFGGATPGTVFLAASAAQRKELLELEAARELTESEAALAEKITPAVLKTAAEIAASQVLG